ncbi:MAG: right-handed parallel beta-helix repeat-containing protein [Thermoleophilaceae bacterium]
MRRLVVILTTLVAGLLAAPAAFAIATTYTVNEAGDQPDATTADGMCDWDTGAVGNQCTLRAAIQQANANVGTDTINFSGAGQSPQPTAGLNAATTAAITDAVTINGGGTTTVTVGTSAAGPLLQSTAANTSLKGITFTGGGSGLMLQLGGDGANLDHVTVSKFPGDGIALAGGNATLSATDVRDGAGVGISLSGNNARVSGGSVHSNAGDGISISGQNDVLGRVVIWGNGGKPIALQAGANGGIQPPQSLRIGPRRADGSLPLTGSTSGGGIDLWAGSPFAPVAPTFLDGFAVGAGDFTYNFVPEPPPGETFALTVTGGGTSEFATVTVPNDIASPDIVRARALSPTDVRVQPSEPLDPNSVQAQDFALSMAGQDRAITGVTPAPDGSSVILTSSGWKAGEAGAVQLTGAGAVTDLAGNNNLAPTRLRVAAAPGDFLAPLAGRLALSPKTICLTRGHGCRVTGLTIKFVTSEAGKATIVIQRSNKRVGKRVYKDIGVGPNTLRFNGRLGGRKLRAGRYRLLLYVQDSVGNVTDQPPLALFSVRRVTR